MTDIIFPRSGDRETVYLKIVGGVPAREIRKRFDDETIAKLLALKWWGWPAEKIAANLHSIQTGDLVLLSEEA